MTNQNNELDEILDSLYCDAWFAGRVAEREQSGIRSVTPKFDEAKKAIQALYAPLKKQQNVNTSTEHVKPVNMSLRQAIQDLEFYTKDGEAIDFIHPEHLEHPEHPEHLEHLDKIMELFNKYTESVDLTKPEVNLIDIASPNMTPEADKVVSDALERSAEVMNKKPVENGELREKIADIFDDLCEPTNQFWHRESGLHYADKVLAHTNAEKLKLLDKFENDCKYNYTTFGNSEKMLQVSGLLKRIEAERNKLKEVK